MIQLFFVGDILLQRRLNLKNPHVQEIKSLFKKSDLVIGNLETTIHNNEGYPAVFPGGCYTMCPPKCLEDLYNLNFRMLNIANNHMMDYGETGLQATLKYLEYYNFAYCGAGINLLEASRPCYYEAPRGRIAMIGATSSFHASYSAGPQNEEIQGRPGVNPLRHNAVYEVPKSQFQQLKQIAHKMGINDLDNYGKKLGYQKESEYYKFGVYNIKEGENFQYKTYPLEADLYRITQNVKEAKNNADLVIVSLHSHQFKNNSVFQEADFIKITAQKCIDSGADIIIGTGPHVFRSIEKYKNGVIFFGLGNFIFQHTLMERIPEEFYQKYDTTRSKCTGVSDIMNIRSENGRKGFFNEKETWESNIVSISKHKNKIEYKLIPIQIFKEGLKADIGLPFINTNS